MRDIMAKVYHQINDKNIDHKQVQDALTALRDQYITIIGEAKSFSDSLTPNDMLMARKIMYELKWNIRFVNTLQDGNKVENANDQINDMIHKING